MNLTWCTWCATLHCLPSNLSERPACPTPSTRVGDAEWIKGETSCHPGHLSTASTVQLRMAQSHSLSLGPSHHSSRLHKCFSKELGECSVERQLDTHQTTALIEWPAFGSQKIFVTPDSLLSDSPQSHSPPYQVCPTRDLVSATCLDGRKGNATVLCARTETQIKGQAR